MVQHIDSIGKHVGSLLQSPHYFADSCRKHQTLIMASRFNSSRCDIRLKYCHNERGICTSTNGIKVTQLCPIILISHPFSCIAGYVACDTVDTKLHVGVPHCVVILVIWSTGVYVSVYHTITALCVIWWYRFRKLWHGFANWTHRQLIEDFHCEV